MTRAHAAISTVAVTFLLAVIAPPWLGAHGYAVAEFGVRHFFAAVCHQRDERSFWILGAPMAVCVRCLGVYAGAAVGSFLRLRDGVAARLLSFALALNLLDVAAESAGLHGSQPWLRLALGAALGLGAGAVLASVPSHGQARREQWSSSAKPLSGGE